MPTPPIPPSPTLPGAAFPDEEYGRESALPPHYADAIEHASADIAQAMADSHSAIDAHVSAAESELSGAQSDIYGSIASQIGGADTDMRPAVSATNTTMQRLSDAAYSALVYAEEDLRANGVAVPDTVEQRIIDTEDMTGANILDRLTGVYPTTGTALLPGAFTGATSGVPDAARGDTTPEDTTDALDGTSLSSPAIPPPTAEPVSAPSTTEPSAECGCAESPPACPAPIIQVTCPTSPPSTASPVSPTTTPDETPTEPEGGGGGETGGGGAGAPAPAMPMPSPDTGASPFPLVAPPGLDMPVVEWWRPDVCARITAALANIRSGKAPQQSGATAELTGGVLSTAYRAAVASKDALLEFATSLGGVENAKQAFLASYRQTGDILGGTSQARTVIDFLPPEIISDKTLIWTLGFTVGTAAQAEGSSGIPLKRFTLPYEYLLNTFCAYEIPSAPELDIMRRTGLIDLDRWKCLLAAHGIDWSLRSTLYDATQPVPSPSEIQSLYLRDSITQDTRDSMLAVHGYTVPAQQSWIESLAVEIPGPSDLVRFMVRDSFDAAVVKQYGYDTDFALKFYGPGGSGNPGPAAKWARANGITEEVMRAHWYAHWQIPSNTALYEAAHRFRPDRPSVLSWDHAAAANGEVAATNAFGPRPLVVTIADIQKAIEVNDMAPNWVPALIASSYHPINRTDAIDAYFSGAFTESDLYEAMRDNGYDETNAHRLVDIQRAKRGGRLANASGVWTQRQILAAYMDGVINGQRADNLLAPLVTDAGVRQQIIIGADQRVEARVTASQINFLKRSHLVGILTDVGAETGLANLGVSETRRVGLVRQWSAARSGRLKEPTAKMVLDWAKGGVLSLDDLRMRLSNLGYMDSDISRMVAQVAKGQSDNLQKTKAQHDRDAKQSVKDAQAAKRAETKDLEARQKAIIKYMKDYEKELAKIDKELRARPKGAPKPSGSIPPESSGTS